MPVQDPTVRIIQGHRNAFPAGGSFEEIPIPYSQMRGTAIANGFLPRGDAKVLTFDVDPVRGTSALLAYTLDGDAITVVTETAVAISLTGNADGSYIVCFTYDSSQIGQISLYDSVATWQNEGSPPVLCEVDIISGNIQSIDCFGRFLGVPRLEFIGSSSTPSPTKVVYLAPYYKGSLGHKEPRSRFVENDAGYGLNYDAGDVNMTFPAQGFVYNTRDWAVDLIGTIPNDAKLIMGGRIDSLLIAYSGFISTSGIGNETSQRPEFRILDSSKSAVTNIDSGLVNGAYDNFQRNIDLSLLDPAVDTHFYVAAVSKSSFDDSLFTAIRFEDVRLQFTYVSLSPSLTEINKFWLSTVAHQPVSRVEPETESLHKITESSGIYAGPEFVNNDGSLGAPRAANIPTHVFNVSWDNSLSQWTVVSSSGGVLIDNTLVSDDINLYLRLSPILYPTELDTTTLKPIVTCTQYTSSVVRHDLAQVSWSATPNVLHISFRNNLSGDSDFHGMIFMVP
jgi:hypothetical protein